MRRASRAQPFFFVAGQTIAENKCLYRKATSSAAYTEMLAIAYILGYRRGEDHAEKVEMHKWLYRVFLAPWFSSTEKPKQE